MGYNFNQPGCYFHSVLPGSKIIKKTAKGPGNEVEMLYVTTQRKPPSCSWLLAQNPQMTSIKFLSRSGGQVAKQSE